MSEREEGSGRSGRSLRLSCPSIIPQREDPGFALRLLRRLKSNGKQRSSTDAIVHVVMATSALFQFAGRPQLNPPASRQFNEATTTTEGGASRHTYQWGRRAGELAAAGPTKWASAVVRHITLSALRPRHPQPCIDACRPGKIGVILFEGTLPSLPLYWKICRRHSEELNPLRVGARGPRRAERSPL